MFQNVVFVIAVLSLACEVKPSQPDPTSSAAPSSSVVLADPVQPPLDAGADCDCKPGDLQCAMRCAE